MTKQTELTEEQKEKLESIDRGIPEDVVVEYINETGDDDLSHLEDSYEGVYIDNEAFAHTMADNCVSEQSYIWPFNCIDWEYAANELMMDYFEIKSHYFRSH